jgi:hypothetical protein
MTAVGTAPRLFRRFPTLRPVVAFLALPAVDGGPWEISQLLPCVRGEAAVDGAFLGSDGIRRSRRRSSNPLFWPGPHLDHGRGGEHGDRSRDEAEAACLRHQTDPRDMPLARARIDDIEDRFPPTGLIKNGSNSL